MIRKYLVKWGFTHPPFTLGEAVIEAYTAEDAITQAKVGSEYKKIMSVEPYHTKSDEPMLKDTE